MTDKAMARRKAKRELARRRMDAGLVYVTDPNSPTIATLSQNPLFNDIPRQKLAAWCRKDKWVQRRAEFFETWTRQARERMAGQLVREQMQTLKEIGELHSIAVGKLKSDTVQPKSWEALYKAVIDGQKFAEELRGTISQVTLPPDGESTKLNVTSEQLGLAADDVQEIAREVLRRRRAGLGDALPEVGAPLLPASTTAPAHDPDPTAGLEAEVLAPAPDKDEDAEDEGPELAPGLDLTPDPTFEEDP